MKRIALLCFIIGLLGVPIQAQAADPSAEELQMFREKQEEVAKVLRNLADLQYRMMKVVAENLPREPEQNAAPPTQYYPAPPAQNCVPLFTQNSDPEAGVRYLFAHPGTRVCPGTNPDLAGQTRALAAGAAARATAHQTLVCSMSGRVC
jgi:hypothetical protein